MNIRQAVLQDIPIITNIYNDAVKNTTAIWNNDVVTQENRKQWLLTKQQQGYPVLVICKNDSVMGYATFGSWRNFDGYQFTVEHSIYIHTDYQKIGLGHKLLIALIEEAKRLNKRVMVAGIESKNLGSIRLHQKLGFEEVGVFKEVGYKFDQWLDLTCLELNLKV